MSNTELHVAGCQQRRRRASPSPRKAEPPSLATFMTRTTLLRWLAGLADGIAHDAVLQRDIRALRGDLVAGALAAFSSRCRRGCVGVGEARTP